MQILTEQEINQECLNIVGRARAFDNVIFTISEMLYKTGLIFSEVMEFDRWEFNTDGTLTVKTAKFSNPRIFEVSELGENFVIALVNEEQFFRGTSPTTVRYYIKRFLNYSNLKVKNKNVSTHLFRHNKAKSLKQEGKSDVQIQAYLGEKEITSAMTYIYSTVYR